MREASDQTATRGSEENERGHPIGTHERFRPREAPSDAERTEPTHDGAHERERDDDARRRPRSRANEQDERTHSAAHDACCNTAHRCADPSLSYQLPCAANPQTQQRTNRGE